MTHTTGILFRDFQRHAAGRLVAAALVFAACSGSAAAFMSNAHSGGAGRDTNLAALEAQVKAGQFDEAIPALEALLQANPHAGPEVYRLLGFSELKRRSSDQALNTCEQGLSLYPESRSLAELYVLTLQQGVPPAERLTRLTMLRKQVPHSPILMKALGEEMIGKDPESVEALGLLSSASRSLPQDPEAHFFYGEAACFNKQDALCVRELTRAHELSPKNEYANMQLYTMIAVAEDRLKHPAKSGEAFSEAMKANVRLPAPSAYAALKYVNFLTAQGRSNEAMLVVEQILKWDPGYGPAHFERAKLLAQHGAAEDAIQEAELALQDTRDSEMAARTYHAFLAKTYFALGRESDARIHQEWIEAHQEAASPQ